MEDENKLCVYKRQVAKTQKKRSLSQDCYDENACVTNKGRALSEDVPHPSGQDRGKGHDLSNNTKRSEPHQSPATQLRDAEEQLPDAVAVSDYSSEPVPAVTDSGDTKQTDVLWSSPLREQPAEGSSPAPKAMGTPELSARRPVDKLLPSPQQQVDAVGELDDGTPPPVAALLLQQLPSEAQLELETMGTKEHRVDVVEPLIDALLSPQPPPPSHHQPRNHSVVREPSGQDGANSAFRALLRPSPSPSTQRGDIHLQPPSLTHDSLTDHQQRPISAGTTTNGVQHTLPKPQASKSRLPPMGTFKAPPAPQPAKDKIPNQLEASNGVSDRAVSPQKVVSSRKRLPTLGQNEEEPAKLVKGKTVTTPKKRRPSQLLPLSAEKGGQEDAQPAGNPPKRRRRDETPTEKKKKTTTTTTPNKRRQSRLFSPGEKDNRENTHAEGRKAPKRQRRDINSPSKLLDAVQVNGVEYQPFHLKRQRSRWNAINTIRLEGPGGGGDENFDRVIDAVSSFHVTPSQSKSSSPDSSQQHTDGNDPEDDNSTQKRQKTKEEKEEEEEQFYHDHAQRSTQDHGKGAVWSALVEPLVSEDREHNLQLQERLQQRRRAREEQAEARRREEMLEEKRRVAREKARERRARKKEEKEEKEKAEKGQEEQEMQDQGVDGAGAVESASVSPDCLRLDQQTT